MKEMTIIIPDDTTGLVAELVEKLGGSVEVKEKKKTSAVRTPSIKPVKKKSKKKVSPTFLFGKWKDFDIDARKIREEIWRRKF